MKDRHSKRFFEDARRYLVGGVNSPVRSFRAVGGSPLVMKYGRRQQLFDYDGNAFTDYCLSWGALITGHAHRNVILAAKKAAEKGLSFGTTTREEIELARHIVQAVPSVEMIRFVNSGTEATMSAIRLARGYTGRDLLVKFDGCYHGHFDDLLTAAGSGVAMLPESSSQGIPEGHIANTISLPYNDLAALEQTFRQHPNQIACVIVEPVAGNMGVIQGTPEFLDALRRLTREAGTVLIFDEIMSGFRGGPGGVQSWRGVMPDLTCLGKIIGGGFPIGAYGGRAEIMRHLAPLGGVYQAGTFSGNPVVMKAGLAQLRTLSSQFYTRLNENCQGFVEEVNRFFKDQGIAAHLVNYKSMISLRFRAEPVLNYSQAQAAAGGRRYQKLFYFLLARGIYLPPADLESFFVSGAHTKADLNKLAQGLKDFFIQEEIHVKKGG